MAQAWDIMSIDPTPRTCLLILERERSVVPVSTSAFTVAQAPRRELAHYIGGLVIDRDGTARRIENIKVLGAWGDKPMRRLLSVLTSAWRIKTTFSQPLEMKFEDMRATIAANLNANYLDSVADNPAVVEARVREARDVAAIFEALRVPLPEDALDVL